MSRAPPPDPQPPEPPGLVRRAEQAAAGGLLACALVAIALWCLAQRRLGSRLIDIEEAPPQPATFQVDVNQAAWPELALLPGIGPELAQRIVADRQARGPFRRVEDLRRVRGIGPKTLERMRVYLAPLDGTRAPPSSDTTAAARP
jgi:competence protein ComEA